MPAGGTGRGWRSLAAAAVALALLSGCDGPQSALDPAGVEAERLAQLFWWMVGVAAVIWLIVIGLAVYATRINAEGAFPAKPTRNLIIGAGTLIPTVVLGGLLGYGLYLMPRLTEAEASYQIAVSGEQWWWRVRYRLPDGGWVESANEIRLPVGVRTEFLLTSPDVIHSFWIPSLAGKLDMVPGRTNRFTVEPTATGTYRGACAEYCGTAHALMAFPVVVMEPEAFEQWLQQLARPAQPPADELAAAGKRLFLANGCGACHVIRGTRADGELGPALTHVGSRLSLAAGTLPATPENFARWIARPKAIKPGALMPGFGMLAEEDIAAMAHYLEGLE